MKITEEKNTFLRTYRSEKCPEIFSNDGRDREIIEWLDENPVAYSIVTGTKSKAFGKNSSFYVTWVQNNNSVAAVIEKLATLKRHLSDKVEKWLVETWRNETIFNYRAKFTLEHYKDKGFTGGFFQQWDGEKSWYGTTFDYTPELFNEVLREFRNWIGYSHGTTRITVSIEGKIMKEIDNLLII